MTILEQLNKFMNLPQGWDYGKGRPLSDRARITARELIKLAVVCNKTVELNPTTDGGVTLTLSQPYSEEFICIEVDHYGGFDVCLERGIGNTYTSVEIELK